MKILLMGFFLNSMAFGANLTISLMSKLNDSAVDDIGFLWPVVNLITVLLLWYAIWRNYEENTLSK